MVRIAEEKDAEALLGIYSWYVENTAITFEYAVPSAEEFAGRIRDTLLKYPYLICERGGEIAGYAYAGVFHARPAYDWSVETSIYVKRNLRHAGVGRELYAALENALSLQHIINVNACIATPVGDDPFLDRNSHEFHRHMGYAQVGEFHACAYKFGRWYDMTWMERAISEHPEQPQAVLPFPQIREQLAKKYGIK